MSDLLTLPLDAFRHVLAMLDLQSCINLFATFNSGIQKRLSSPGAFDELRLSAVAADNMGPYRYFLRNIRDVSTLVLARSTQWEPTALGVLPSLNPKTLDLAQAVLHRSSMDLLNAYIDSPEENYFKTVASYFCWDASPNFARLTPRLTTLKVYRWSDFIIKAYATPLKPIPPALVSSLPLGFSFPPTLTSLQTIEPSFIDGDLKTHLPSTLKTLKLSGGLGELSLRPIFITCPQLEWLRVTDISTVVPSSSDSDHHYLSAELLQPIASEDGTIEQGKFEDFPASMRRLALHRLSFFPRKLFTTGILKRSSLTRLTLWTWLDDMHDEPLEISLAEQLPSLLVLHLCLKSGPIILSDLPKSLVRLHLTLYEVIEQGFIQSIASLSQLKEIYLTDNCGTPASANQFQSIITSLPHSVEYFRVVGIDLTLDTVRVLPPNITSLHLGSFNLDHLTALHSRLSGLKQFKVDFPGVEDSPEPLKTAIMMQHFAGTNLQSIDLPSYWDSFFGFFASHKIEVDVSWLIHQASIYPKETTEISFLHCSAHMSHFSIASLHASVVQRWKKIVATVPIPGFDTLKLPHFKALTHLEFGADTDTTIRYSTLPHNLTSLHLASGNALIFDQPTLAPLMLRSLVAPFSTCYWESLKNCDVIFAYIEDIQLGIKNVPDASVISFLTSILPPSSRPKSRLSIHYLVTGALIVDKEALSKLSTDAIGQQTDTILKNALELPYHTRVNLQLNLDTQCYEDRAKSPPALDGSKIGDIIINLQQTN